MREYLNIFVTDTIVEQISSSKLQNRMFSVVIKKHVFFGALVLQKTKRK